MRVAGAIAAAVIVLLALWMLLASAYAVDEAEQVVIVQFGKPIGGPVTEPGLHFKLPFVQEIRRFDKRLLAWDGDPNQIPTRGREFISVDTTARWRIVDPMRFMTSVRDEIGARTRLDDIIDSVVRDEVSSLELVEIVRSKNWQIDDERLAEHALEEKQQELLRQQVEVGRQQLEADILAEAAKHMEADYGIELVDVRIKRINYVPSVQRQVFQRMVSERQRIAAQFRSEGEGRSAEILGKMRRQVQEIESEARRKAEIIRGEADAQATGIYNQAYSKDPEFFAFLRTLESYAASIGEDATLILDTDSDYFRYLRRIGKPDTP